MILVPQISDFGHGERKLHGGASSDDFIAGERVLHQGEEVRQSVVLHGQFPRKSVVLHLVLQKLAGKHQAHRK